MASQWRGSSLPSSGDHCDSEKAGASCWSPRTWRLNGNFGLRVEDAAPRSFAPRDSGRPIRVRTRREVRPAGPALCPLRCNPAEELIRASTARPARSVLSQHAVILPASRFASHSIAPQAASASPGTASARSLVLPTSSEICPRAYVRESNPCEKRRGFLVLPSASCSATPQRSRPKPQQTDSHASLQSTCQPRALHMTRIASRTARACLGTASAPSFFFGVSDPLGILPQGRHTGMTE